MWGDQETLGPPLPFSPCAFEQELSLDSGLCFLAELETKQASAVLCLGCSDQVLRACTTQVLTQPLALDCAAKHSPVSEV